MENLKKKLTLLLSSVFFNLFYRKNVNILQKVENLKKITSYHKEKTFFQVSDFFSTTLYSSFEKTFFNYLQLTELSDNSFFSSNIQYKNNSPISLFFKSNFFNKKPSTFKDNRIGTGSWKLRIWSLHKKNFILSNAGFLSISSKNLQLCYKASYTSSRISKKVKYIKHRFSFLYRDELKRSYLHEKQGFLKLLEIFAPLRKSQRDLFFTPELWAFSRSGNISQHRFYKNPDFTSRFMQSEFLTFRPTIFYSSFEKFEPHEDPRPIKRIRFKPGYQRIWRRARASINEHLGFNYRYQARLTRKMTDLKRIRVIFGMKFHELRLEKIILRSRFALDDRASTPLISNGIVFVNGLVSTNHNMYLYSGDFVQLYVNLKYYIVYRWLHNWRRCDKAKYTKLLNYKTNASQRDLSKQVSRHLPNWIFSRLLKNFDIPKYCETDFFTLSTFVLFEPYIHYHFSTNTLIESRTEIYPMYNWKYIN